MHTINIQTAATRRIEMGHYRKSSPERSNNTPLRQRPASPLKVDHDDSCRSVRLLDLAKKERALSELKERKRELEAQIANAEMELDLAKRQLTIGCSSNATPLKALSTNIVRNSVGSVASTEARREKDLEPFQHIAEGMACIWKDVVQATIGEQAKR